MNLPILVYVMIRLILASIFFITSNLIAEGQIYERFDLSDSSYAELYTPESSATLLVPVKQELKTLYDSYQEILGELPELQVKVFLMSEEDFFELTETPRWTNAIFYKQQILVPIKAKQKLSVLKKAIRHEFSHAVIESLSEGHCPAWLDEGLAQWAEGVEPVVLSRVMQKWLKKNEIINFKDLSKGFLSLDRRLVAPAYAQSFYASKLLVKLAGKERLREYFANLKHEHDNSFEHSFGFEQDDFSVVLASALSRSS